MLRLLGTQETGRTTPSSRRIEETREKSSAKPSAIAQGQAIASPPLKTHVPSTIPATSSAKETAPAPSPEAVDKIQQNFEASTRYFSGEKFNEALAYFNTVAANSEFNGSKPITKWKNKIKIALHGDYNEADWATVNQMTEVYNRIEGMPELSVLTEDLESANVNIYFVLSEDMPFYFSSYVEGNSGFFEVYWDGNYELYRSVIAISTNRTKAADRNHLIWEELTQSLGLMNDSYKYEDSIFQQQYSYVQYPSPIDFAILRMLYEPQVKSGQSAEEAIAILKNLYR